MGVIGDRSGLELSTGGDREGNQGRYRRMSAGCSDPKASRGTRSRIVTAYCRSQSEGPGRPSTEARSLPRCLDASLHKPAQACTSLHTHVICRCTCIHSVPRWHREAHAGGSWTPAADRPGMNWATRRAKSSTEWQITHPGAVVTSTLLANLLANLLAKAETTRG